MDSGKTEVYNHILKCTLLQKTPILPNAINQAQPILAKK